MKIITIIFLTLIYISVLNADLPGFTLEEARANYESSLKLNQILFDGILQSKIEFSQEEYKVGDIIDISIHFEINTEKNKSKRNFVIRDIINNELYYPRYFWHRYQQTNYPDQILTKDQVIGMQNAFKNKDSALEYIDSDSDLFLSNDHPSGTYNIKFKLKEKVICPTHLNKQYPYRGKYVNVCSYTKKEEYEHFTEYFGKDINLIIPIKIHSDALDESNKPKPKIMKFPTENKRD